MRFEILDDNGFVVNTIVADLSFVESRYAGRYRLLDNPEPAVVPVIPQVVTPFQAKAALLTQGLLDDVEALIADPNTDTLVALAWRTALEFRRTSPAVLGMAQALGWSDEQLDDLFTLAAQLEV